MLAFPQLYQRWAYKNKSFSKAINPEPFTNSYSNSHVQNNSGLFIQTSKSICHGVNDFAAMPGCGFGSCGAAPEQGRGKQRPQGKTNYISSSQNQSVMFLKGIILRPQLDFLLPALLHALL